MPSPLKRPIPGRLGRFLASLRPPARTGPLPVQTGFPTSLADLVVKNHVRLRKPKKRRPTTVASSPTLPVAAAASAEEPPSQPRPELSLVQDTVQAPKDAAFTLRPELLALGGVVALAVLAIWSKGLVAAFTALSLSLLWTESVRSASRRRPTEAKELLDLCGRGPVSPIREVESEMETPRSSSADSDKGSEAPSIWSAERSELGAGAAVDPINPERKQRRSLRKLIAKKLHKSKKPKEKAEDSSAACDGDGKESDSGGTAEPAEIEAFVASTEPTASESSREEEEGGDGRGRAFPFAAFIPVVLVGLVAGKLPATALTVLCVVLSCSVDRLPAS